MMKSLAVFPLQVVLSAAYSVLIVIGGVCMVSAGLCSVAFNKLSYKGE
jgi:hypothetical protein